MAAIDYLIPGTIIGGVLAYMTNFMGFKDWIDARTGQPVEAQPISPLEEKGGSGKTVQKEIDDTINRLLNPKPYVPPKPVPKPVPKPAPPKQCRCLGGYTGCSQFTSPATCNSCCCAKICAAKYPGRKPRVGPTGTCYCDIPKVPMVGNCTKTRFQQCASDCAQKYPGRKPVLSADCKLCYCRITASQAYEIESDILTRVPTIV